MKLISTKVHGVLDYLSGVLFIVSPWLLGFAENDTAKWVALIAGVAVLGLSALTNYEAGLTRRIPMSVHLTIDALLGVLLIASPWLLGFANYTYLPHVIFGALELGAALLTQRTPSYDEATPKLT